MSNQMDTIPPQQQQQPQQHQQQQVGGYLQPYPYPHSSGGGGGGGNVFVSEAEEEKYQRDYADYGAEIDTRFQDLTFEHEEVSDDEGRPENQANAPPASSSSSSSSRGGRGGGSSSSSAISVLKGVLQDLIHRESRSNNGNSSNNNGRSGSGSSSSSISAPSSRKVYLLSELCPALRYSGIIRPALIPPCAVLSCTVI